MCRATSDSYVQDRMSDLISLLRFPLMVTVVLLHCSFDLVMRNGMLEDSVCYADYTCFRLFVTEITNAAVALFFVFSGYLFFRNGTLTLHSYGNKLQKRFYTILLPFVRGHWCRIGVRRCHGGSAENRSSRVFHRRLCDIGCAGRNEHGGWADFSV